MPRGCRRASTFILDTSCLDHSNDYKADDNGSFRHHVVKVECIELDDDGEVTCIADPKMLRPGQYKLSRTYWVHSSMKDYKKRSVILEDHSGEVYPVIILQYSNTGKEEDVKVEPHQNSKKSHRPYYATKQCINEKAKSSLGPSSIYDELYEEGGGVVENTSFASVPRGISQVKYQSESESDPNYKSTVSRFGTTWNQSSQVPE